MRDALAARYPLGMAARRYIGDAVITLEIEHEGMGPRVEYKGTIRAGGYSWRFDKLSVPIFNKGSDSPEAFDEAAASAAGFGSYYTTYNRGDDVPDWAPSPEVADAIDEAVSFATNDQGSYFVRRKSDAKRGNYRG